MIATEDRASASIWTNADFRFIFSLSPCIKINPVMILTTSPIIATIKDILISIIAGFKNLSIASYRIHNIDKTMVIPFTNAARTSTR